MNKIVVDESPKQLIFLSYDPDKDSYNNPQVKCPDCGHVSGIMNDFSLLEFGCNGVVEGSDDDCGLQECGHCEGRFDDADVWAKVDKVHLDPDEEDPDEG